MSDLTTALELAAQAHRGQQRKNGLPYVLHPLRLMQRMTTPEARIVAVLHDVVEDSELTLESLREAGFSEEIVAAVDALTKRAGEPYEQLVERAARVPLARVVKLADLEDNMDLRELPELTDEAVARLRRSHAAWRRLSREGAGAQEAAAAPAAKPVDPLPG